MRRFLQRVGQEFKDFRFFRRNTGVLRVDDRVFKAGVPGQCDLYVIGLGGWHGEVELKRFGRLSPEQAHWRDWCICMRVPWICLSAHPEELSEETIERWTSEMFAWLPTRAS